MKTCFHCAKTDKLVSKRSQASLGYSDKTMYWSSPALRAESDRAYWYHPACFAKVDKEAEIELFVVAV